ncbi:MAG: hypothetical protein ACK4YM_00695 [Novosphingobium sp.]
MPRFTPQSPKAAQPPSIRVRLLQSSAQSAKAAAAADSAGIPAIGRGEFSRPGANSYPNGLAQVVRRLAADRLIGPTYPSLRPPIRYLSYRSHHIFDDTDGIAVWHHRLAQPSGTTVSIIRVLHHAQDAARLL